MNEMNLTSEFNENTQVKTPPRKSVRALIITPTRELAIQIKNHLEDLNKYTKKHIKVAIM